MFSTEMQIMLYVTDVDASVKFWEALDFVVVDRQEVDGTAVVEIASSENAQARFVLYDREFIMQHSPEVASNTPSIMFFAKDVLSLYKKMQGLGVTVGEMVQLEERLVFNFADNDENYYAVSELN
ncbi:MULTISPECIES: VOC family protein [Enterococcus]|uniref:VOC family protein n=1 Tax=Enterococcus TaxID=1350 RepID=UPI00065E589F|nr:MULTISPECIES: VOC family protein [Enterococcus]KAF1304709.1 glyoxalase [Enterococcus sp. JM9B]